MSRIGRMPIAVPAGVTVDIAENNHVTVKGPKGTLERTLPSEMDIKLEGDEIIVTRPNDLKKMKSLHGLTRTLINNMVVGVTNGYTKELEVNGVGYRASKAGKVLTLNLGYSHPVEMEDPEGLESKVDGNKIIVSGIVKNTATGIEENVADAARAWTVGSTLYIHVPGTSDVYVVSGTGALQQQLRGVSGDYNMQLRAGFYIVRIGNVSQKVIIR